MINEITEITGAAKGPTSVILAGVHGDERSGLLAFESIIPNFSIESGKVLFMIGNPQAITSNARFTQANLNRMFKPPELFTESELHSYEYQRAQILKTYLNQSDALLDIHNSFTPDSRPFIICEPNSNDITKYLPVQDIVFGFDKVEPGGTDYYMNQLGKIGICVETGYLGDDNSTLIAEQSIMSFLKARGHIANDLKEAVQTQYRMYQLYLTKTNSFKLAKQFADFEQVPSGTTIGVDGTVPVQAEKDSMILFARERKVIGEEAFLLGEKVIK